MRKGILLVILTILTFNVFGQEKRGTIEIDGEIVNFFIGDNGDTILSTVMDSISVSSKRKFKSSKERRHYERMKYNTAVAYPYALEAIEQFRRLEMTTKGLSKHNKKEETKELQIELERKFKADLKNLTEVQGKILISMIERELNRPMYDLVKDLKGSFSASYWNTLAKAYNVDLKEGYDSEEDAILELLLEGMF